MQCALRVFFFCFVKLKTADNRILQEQLQAKVRLIFNLCFFNQVNRELNLDYSVILKFVEDFCVISYNYLIFIKLGSF